MRKISKAITNKKFLKKSDNLYSKDTISLDNPKNRKYLDNIAYQEYLRKIQKESSDYNDQ
ncbi:MAG: hypothetical protein ACLTPN_05865 [Clostridia bacterium]|jgi:hypothetical protein